MGRELLWGDSEAIKLFSMRGIPQVLNYLNETHVIGYSCLSILLTYVKKPIARGVYAWVDLNFYSTHQRLNKEYLNKNNKTPPFRTSGKGRFEQWLVGMTDGDGTFSIVRQNGKWNLAYKITQSRYNLRVLYYIKEQLGVGSVTKDNTKGQFFIRDRKKLESVIFPIFDKYPLLTSKMFNYKKFKKAHSILEDNTLTKDEKDKALFQLRDEELPKDYISPIWSNASLPLENVNNINNVMTKPWLIGFIEAEGSFYLVSKDWGRIVHQSNFVPSIVMGGFDNEFSIRHKTDRFLLHMLKRLLHIPNKIIYDYSMNTYVLKTRNSRAILNIVNLFSREFKGMKSLEFKLWSKAKFYSDNKKVEKVEKIHKILFKIQKKNLL